jgi:hypothetical protein
MQIYKICMQEKFHIAVNDLKKNMQTSGAIVCRLIMYFPEIFTIVVKSRAITHPWKVNMVYELLLVIDHVLGSRRKFGIAFDDLLNCVEHVFFVNCFTTSSNSKHPCFSAD